MKKIIIKTAKKYRCPKCGNLNNPASVAAGRGHDCLRCRGARYDQFQPVTSILRLTVVDGFYTDSVFETRPR
jgi:DNA-directed RNA polymerase subunit RPC12/RpoP